MYNNMNIDYVMPYNAFSRSNNILYDILYSLVMIPLNTIVNKLSFNVVHYIVTYIMTLNYRKKKSVFTIPIMINADEARLNFPNNARSINDIPKQYLAILYYMYVNNIDPKYIKQILNQRYESYAGLSNDSKLGIIKKNEEIKYKFLIEYPDEIKLTDNIFMTSSSIRNDINKTDMSSNNGNTNNPFRDNLIIYDVQVYSYTLNSVQLRNTVYDWVNVYDSYLKNLTKNKLYYLIYNNANVSTKQGSNNMSQFSGFGLGNMYNEKSQNSVASFEMHEFETHKNFNNVFFEQKQLLLDKLNFFINRKDYYDRLGQQYTFGLLFHGDPGCGKTSTIKAIANLTKRNIISVPLSKVKTFKELRDIFFTEEYESINLEFDKKIIVFEDIDCMTDIIKERTKDKTKNVTKKDKKDKINKNKEDVNSDITLSDILNLMDGILEQSGRMIIMTSNYPERIDKALLRFGRIDMKIEFKLCNHDIATQIIEHYYGEKLPLNLLITDYRYSASEILEICFKTENINDLVNLLNNMDANYVESNTDIDKLESEGDTDSESESDTESELKNELDKHLKSNIVDMDLYKS